VKGTVLIEGAQPEIDNFELIVVIYENIFRFEISMCDSIRVEIFDG
jgi:hypothetical protein